MEALIRMERIEKLRCKKLETPWIQNIILFICIIISIVLIINYNDDWVRGTVVIMILLFILYVVLNNLRRYS